MYSYSFAVNLILFMSSQSDNCVLRSVTERVSQIKQIQFWWHQHHAKVIASLISFTIKSFTIKSVTIKTLTIKSLTIKSYHLRAFCNFLFKNFQMRKRLFSTVGVMGRGHQRKAAILCKNARHYINVFMSPKHQLV